MKLFWGGILPNTPEATKNIFSPLHNKEDNLGHQPPQTNFNMALLALQRSKICNTHETVFSPLLHVKRDLHNQNNASQLTEFQSEFEKPFISCSVLLEFTPSSIHVCAT